MAAPRIRFGLKGVVPISTVPALRPRTIAQLRDEALVARERRAAAACERAAAAFSALMNTVELLEHILLYVPARGVLVAQRVCRQFRDIVATSKPLRWHLLLIPSTVVPQERWGVVEISPPGPSAQPVRSVLRVAESEAAHASFQTTGLRTTTDGRPLLYRPAAQLSPWLKFTYHHNSLAIWDRMLDAGERTVLNKEPSLISVPALWKAAYPADVPCRNVQVMLEWFSTSDDSVSGRAVGALKTEAPNGFTLGDILNGMMAANDLHTTVYINGKTTEWSLNGTLDRLKGDAGAMLKSLQIDLKDVVLPSEDERAGVKDV